MRSLLAILGLFWCAERWRFLAGLAMAIVTIAAGVALLGLSGWFITASAVAGVAGVGLTFDFFRPSAGIRFLALLRTFSRYGERLTTHDATLAFLARARRRLFDVFAADTFVRLGRLKSGEVLARITADVDSLDSVYLRLLVPLAGAVALIVATALAVSLISPRLAVLMAAILLAGFLLAVVSGIRLGAAPGRKVALAREALRIRLIDLTKGLVELRFAGVLDRQGGKVLRADAFEIEAGRRVNRAEIVAGRIMFLAGQTALLAVLVAGAPLVVAGDVSAAQLALIALAILALQEATGATARGLGTVGRTLLAARRLAPALTSAVAPAGKAGAMPAANDGRIAAGQALIGIQNISYSWPGARESCLKGVSLDLAPGDRIALAGPSGAGKSTLLALAAGLVEPTGGTVSWGGKGSPCGIALLPQASRLFSASIADNLRLAAPDAGDVEIWRALEIARIADEIRALPQEIGTHLGERGAGLSGGQLRRLAIARMVLLRPNVFLLDEPTEGLAEDQGRGVLKSLFAAHPDAAFLVATHRPGERDLMDRVITVHDDMGNTAGTWSFTPGPSFYKR